MQHSKAYQKQATYLMAYLYILTIILHSCFSGSMLVPDFSQGLSLRIQSLGIFHWQLYCKHSRLSNTLSVTSRTVCLLHTRHHVVLETHDQVIAHMCIQFADCDYPKAPKSNCSTRKNCFAALKMSEKNCTAISDWKSGPKAAEAQARKVIGCY